MVSPITAIDALQRLAGTQTKAPEKVLGLSESFGDALLKELHSASALAKDSGRLSTAVTLGNPTVGLEETMVASTKSGIAFQATVTFRNKVMQAYTDVMNMQV